MQKIYFRIIGVLLTVLAGVSVEAQIVNAGADITLPCNTNCATINATLQGITGSSNYTVTSEPYSSAILPYSAGTTLFTAQTDDQWSGAVTMPFTFNFYCQNFTQLWVGSNGEITFTQQSGYCYFPAYAIPTANLPNYSIVGYHRDLYAYSTTPTYTTTGTTPNRRFIINWNNVGWYGGGGNATFQIVLHETTNIIETFIASSGNTQATVGIQQNSTTGLTPSGRNSVTFNPVQEGWRYTPSSTSTPTVSLTTLTGLLVQNGNPVQVGSNYTVSFPNVCPTTDTGVYVVEATYSCGGTYKDTISIFKTVTPPPTVTTPVSYCQNSTAQPLSAQGQNLLWYTVPTGGTGSTTAPTPVTTTAMLDTIWVTQTINNCESARVPIYITIKPQPTVTAGSNSPICAGSTLSLTATFTSNATYTWTGPNFFSSTAQNPNVGNAQPVNSGTYTVYATLNGCQSTTSSVTVVVTANPFISTANITNATQCNGTGAITLSGLTANTSYTVNFTKNGTPQTAVTITSNGSGQVVITNLGAGTYTNISVTISGCISNLVGPLTITQPASPVITNTSANPTTCNGTNGSITLNGLTNGVSYTISYTKNGVPQTAITQTASGGSVNIPNLTAGTYTNISVTAVVTNCPSNVIAQVILTDPAAPTITVTSTNPTVCNSSTGTITISGLTSGTSYTINYIINGVPQAALTQTATNSSIVLSNLAAGSYTGITVTVNACISNSGSATLTDPAGPVITAVPNNPTQCNTNTGSIVLNGLINGMSYTITYSKNGVPQTAITQTAANNSVNIPNLSSGSYSNIFVTINSCSSNILGPISLSDPQAPAVPVAGSNSPVCAGQPINFTASSTTTGVTYNWTGPNNYTSTQQNPTIAQAQLNQAGTYNVTASLNGCTSAAAPVTVVVNPSPATPIAGVNNPVCQGGNINLTATTSTTGVTWTWTGPNNYSSTQQNPTITGATPAQSGNYIVYATANGCPSISDTAIVNVIATPAIQYTSTNPTACGSNTGSITLNGLITGSSYVINFDKNSVPQAAITQTAAGGTVSINNLSAGTYTNITVSLNGCPSNIVGPVTLTDPTQPPTPVAGSNSPLCVGDALNLTATAITNATYSWTGPNGFTSTLQNPGINPVTLAAAGSYSVVAIVNGCTSQPGSVNVVVKPVPPVPNITINTPVCEGGVLNLNSNTIPGVTYNWTGPNGFVSYSEDTVLNNVQPAMSGIYTLVVSNGDCDASASAPVTVNPTPGAPVVASPVELCQYDTVFLTAQGQNLLWYDVPTGGTGAATQMVASQSAGSLTYYVSQTVNGCESPRASVSVVVKPRPFPPSGASVYSYCQYAAGATQLSASGNNVQWYDDQGNPITAPTPNTNIPGVFTYYATQTDNGCESERLEVTVTINVSPGLPVVEQVTVCQGEPVPALTAQGQNLQWYDSATGGTGTTTAPVPNTADTGVTDYYVSQTVNGCEGGRSLLRVTVNPKVEAMFTIDKDTLCDSYPLTVTFTGTAPTTANFDWDFDGASQVTGSGAGPYTVIWSTEGIKTITLSVSNLNCSSSASGTVVVLPTPDPSFTLQPDACVGEEVRVKVAWDQLEMPGYAWDFGGAQVLEGTGAGPYTLKWNTPGSKVVSLSLTNIPCPSLPYSDTIHIHRPSAKIESVSVNDICTADSVLFTAQPGLDYYYQWSPLAYFGAGDDASGLSRWGRIRAAGYAYLTVTDRWGCQATDSVLMRTKSCCEVFLPNAFTPNGDGSNDVFRMVTSGNQDISTFIIVNRYGRIVFETANQAEGWDGTYRGEAQDIGTYQYYLKYKCADNNELIEMKGDVILLR